MHLIRGLHNIAELHRGCAITIGNFDGLHLGHQALLKALKKTAAEHQCLSCLMTFDPLPSEFFNRENAGARLMNTREKLYAFEDLSEDLSPDYFMIMAFNKALASMPAEEFTQTILIDALNIKSIVIGDDFHFGSDRAGSYESLKLAGETHGFEVIAISTQVIDGLRVSSTRIREALEAGDFDDAEKMLAKPYTICGKITHGDKRGRTIGFPTANIQLRRLRSPIHGVYSVTMHSEHLGSVPGIANIGKRPTVDGERIQLEVHLFDFDEDIYDHNVCVSFQSKIRGEKKFESFEALKQQIILDCEKARNLL